MTEPEPVYEIEETRFDDEFWAKLFRVLHRVLVTVDDFLCAEFKFSRRARGKWTKRLTPDP